MDDPRDEPLRRNRDFQAVFVGQAISGLGDAITFTVLPLLVLQLTGSGAAMGIVGILITIPDLIIGLPAGAIADRVDRRRLMLGADAGRAVLTALIPLSVLLGLPTMAVILVVVAPINILQVLFMAGWTGSIPNLVGRRHVGAAVGAIEAATYAMFVIGPAIAGVLVGVIGAAWALVVDAASFALSALSLALVRRPLQGARETREGQPGILASIREGVVFIRGHRVLRVAIALWTAVSIAMTGLVAAVTYATLRDRGMAPTDLGLILSGYGLGGLGGAIVGGRIAHGRLARQLLGGLLLTGVAVTVLGSPVALPVLIVLSVLAGFGQMITLIAYLTYRSIATPEAMLSRVGATARTISIGLQPLGMLATGLLLDAIGGNATIQLTGVLLIGLAAVFALSSALRSARVDGPQPAPAPR